MRERDTMERLRRDLCVRSPPHKLLSVDVKNSLCNDTRLSSCAFRRLYTAELLSRDSYGPQLQ